VQHLTPEAKTFITTKGENAVSTSTLDVSVLLPCMQEKPDYCIAFMLTNMGEDDDAYN